MGNGNLGARLRSLINFRGGICMKYNPTAEGERIKKLMERIESGDIKIPKFQ